MNKLTSSILLLSAATLAGCRHAPPPELNQTAAISVEGLKNPLAQQVITEWIDTPQNTLSMLMGDDAAISAARSGKSYSDGATLSAVTWLRQEDPRWFGGRIPSEPQSVEVLHLAQPTPTYTRYEGIPLRKVDVDPDTARARITFLLDRRPAVMP